MVTTRYRTATRWRQQQQQQHYASNERSYLESAKSDDVASPSLLDLLSVVGVHLKHTSHALRLALHDITTRVRGISTRQECSKIFRREGDTIWTKNFVMFQCWAQKDVATVVAEKKIRVKSCIRYEPSQLKVGET